MIKEEQEHLQSLRKEKLQRDLIKSYREVKKETLRINDYLSPITYITSKHDRHTISRKQN